MATRRASINVSSRQAALPAIHEENTGSDIPIDPNGPIKPPSRVVNIRQILSLTKGTFLSPGSLGTVTRTVVSYSTPTGDFYSTWVIFDAVPGEDIKVVQDSIRRVQPGSQPYEHFMTQLECDPLD